MCWLISRIRIAGRNFKICKVILIAVGARPKHAVTDGLWLGPGVHQSHLLCGVSALGEGQEERVTNIVRRRGETEITLALFQFILKWGGARDREFHGLILNVSNLIKYQEMFTSMHCKGPVYCHALVIEREDKLIS